MKKIILLLILTLTLFANDGCKLDVYFGNGIWNDREAARQSKIALKYFVQQHNPDRFLLPKRMIIDQEWQQ